MKNSIRAILVDDVESVRSVIRKLLTSFENIAVIGEASDFEHALQLIEDEKPDLLFLDVDLNGLTSMDLLKRLNYEPMVIFITSHSDFAIKAFEYNAIDYMLKPISIERLSKAIEKVTNKWNHKTGLKNNSIDDNDIKFGVDHIILLSFDDKLNFIRVRDISHIEAFGNYTKVYLADGRLSVTYNSIRNWVNRLPEDLFIQIHRSTIINLSMVKKIEKWTNDTGRLFMNGQFPNPFEISRNYFFELKKKYKM